MSSIPRPTGTGVGTNFLRGLQARNQRNLLEIFKAAAPVMEEIAKVKPESWRNMRGLFTALEGSFGGRVRAAVSGLGTGALTPLRRIQGQAANVLEGALAPVMVGINNLSNQIEAFALRNPAGATVGALGGFVAGFILPGGPLLWSMIGGFAGGFIEEQIKTGVDLQWWEFILGPAWVAGRLIVHGLNQGGGLGQTQIAATAGALPFDPGTFTQRFPELTGRARRTALNMEFI